MPKVGVYAIPNCSRDIGGEDAFIFKDTFVDERGIPRRINVCGIMVFFS